MPSLEEFIVKPDLMKVAGRLPLDADRFLMDIDAPNGTH